jgi:hypothetical protein
VGASNQAAAAAVQQQQQQQYKQQYKQQRDLVSQGACCPTEAAPQLVALGNIRGDSTDRGRGANVVLIKARSGAVQGRCWWWFATSGAAQQLPNAAPRKYYDACIMS